MRRFWTKFTPWFERESFNPLNFLEQAYSTFYRRRYVELDFGLMVQRHQKCGCEVYHFFGRNDAEAEAPVLWPPCMKSWLTGKDSDAGRDWKQEEKGTTEDEMAGWHHGLDGHESEWTPGVGDGQGGLGCCDSWGQKESDTTEWLNWTESVKLAKLQDTKSIHRNHLRFYMLTMKNQKEKLRNQSHSPLQQKELNI